LEGKIETELRAGAELRTGLAQKFARYNRTPLFVVQRSLPIPKVEYITGNGGVSFKPSYP
jgi:hypothetical protein